ncbi:MAG: hypothetical protein AAGA56_17175, partial [Myxococcota bacterium]
MAPSASRPSAGAVLLAVFASLASLGASCSQSAVTLLPGVVNDPSNRSLRRSIFRFATDEICEELLQRSVPLKLRPSDPNIGRFFPLSCNITELANEKNLF